MIRLVARFNRRAGGRLGEAAVVLEGDCATADHTQAHADIQTLSNIYYTAERTKERRGEHTSTPMLVSADGSRLGSDAVSHGTCQTANSALPSRRLFINVICNTQIRNLLMIVI